MILNYSLYNDEALIILQKIFSILYLYLQAYSLERKFTNINIYYHVTIKATVIIFRFDIGNRTCVHIAIFPISHITIGL